VELPKPPEKKVLGLVISKDNGSQEKSKTGAVIDEQNIQKEAA
jgi:hypothetical protein